jgi:murein L,D-transpeptidase YcbB/YkuD
LNAQPEFYEYVKLQQALEKYLDEVTLTDYSYYIPDPKLDSVNCYKTAGKILKELGYYNTDTSLVEKETLTKAIKNFQRFHGLTPDGKIGRGTINALSVNTKDRYNKIAMTLEKMRQMDYLTSDGLLVNIPSFKLKIFENNSIVDEYRVIVGNPKTPTPELISNLQTIITNPDWNVPTSIASNEILPKVKSDTTYLKAHNYTIYDENGIEIDPNNVDWDNFNYYLKQGGDAGSALGKVKFLFPNEYSVYLHDTQSRGLFNQDNRALSHGCIRVQNPEKLADYLLKRDNQVLEGVGSVKDLTDNKIGRTFNIQKEIPVQFCYFTCEADDSCNIYFYSDIYNKDVAMQDAVAMQ